MWICSARVGEDARRGTGRRFAGGSAAGGLRSTATVGLVKCWHASVLVEVVPGPAPCAAATENAVGLAANNRDGLRRPFRFGGLESEVNAEASEPVMK